MKQKAYIRSTGMYVPEKIVTNHDLPKELETNDEWIRQRSGIIERRYADKGVVTSDLAKKAVENLLEKGEVEADEIDCIIFATLSPDIFFPGAGVFLQEKLGWAEKLIPCYDIRQQCSGFIYGIQMAQSFVESGMFSNVLLVGAEIHSNALDFTKRGRAVTVLFGDGAAAVVISPSKNGKSRIIETRAHADGRGAFNGIHMKLHDIGKSPVIDYNPFDFDENEEMYPQMPSSRNLFANAVRRMAEVSASVLKKAKISIDQGGTWGGFPHRANMAGLTLGQTGRGPTFGNYGLENKRWLF